MLSAGDEGPEPQAAPSSGPGPELRRTCNDSPVDPSIYNHIIGEYNGARAFQHPRAMHGTHAASRHADCRLCPSNALCTVHCVLRRKARRLTV